MDTLGEKVEVFKLGIDEELAHLPLEEFIHAVALTKRERKQATDLIKQMNGL